MKTFGPIKNNATLWSLVILCLFVTSCDPQNNTKKCYPCPEAPVQLPYLNFRVVDKTTGHDLFFGSGAPYNVSQLKLLHIINGKPDTVNLTTDTTDHHFNIWVQTVHNTDTVTMQIANKPQDILLFKTTTTGTCCISFTFNSVSFDGSIVFTPSGGPNIVVLTK